MHVPQVVTQSDATTEVKEEVTKLTKEESTKREEKGIFGSIAKLAPKVVKAVGISAVADRILHRDRRQVSKILTH